MYLARFTLYQACRGRLYGRLSAILNFVQLPIFRVHPLLKPCNLFYSNGVTILSCFHDILQKFQLDIPMVEIIGKSAGSTSRSRYKNINNIKYMQITSLKIADDPRNPVVPLRNPADQNG